MELAARLRRQYACTAPVNLKQTRYRSAVWMVPSLILAMTSTACGAYVDGDQWVDVTVTNTTAAAVTLDTRPPRHLAPGRATVLHVNTSNDPQVLHVRADSGEVLGCLVFDSESRDSSGGARGTSNLAACPQAVRSFPG